MGVQGVEQFVEAVISALPADRNHLERYAQAQAHRVLQVWLAKSTVTPRRNQEVLVNEERTLDVQEFVTLRHKDCRAKGTEERDTRENPQGPPRHSLVSSSCFRISVVARCVSIEV